jgi:general stress protein 26
VSYSDPQKDHYVSISGRASVNEDMRQKESLFNALTKAWFPGGVKDPDLELVQVKIEHAEFWDIKESKTTQLYKMARAAVTGEVPHMGEHRELHPG